MAKQFTANEWQQIWHTLATKGDAHFGLPKRRDGSLLFASWNIRKFGAERRSDGTLARSEDAYRLIETFCARCDFIAIQEVQDSLWSVRHLRDRLNHLRPDADYRLVASDVTGKAPGFKGMKERLAFLYDRRRVEQTEIASDITLDLTAVLTNVNASIDLIKTKVREGQPAGFLERIRRWFEEIQPFKSGQLPAFIQFIRSPHLVTFRVPGDPGHSYEIACVNAHLLSGTETEREREFFALLEWLFLRSENKVQQDAPITLLLADLNLSFDSDNDARKRAIEEFIVELNRGRLGQQDAKVNFPFLDTPPGRVPIRTNAREDETYDHIAWLANDDRFPRGRHNGSAGSLGGDEFDYGMFNFTQLFRDSGVVSRPDGSMDFSKFEHDVSDHMPIWLRLVRPHAGQHRFITN